MKGPQDSPKIDFEVYEIFAKTSPDGGMEHQFSLLARSPRMALLLARENFLRRRTVYAMWAVRREDIFASADLSLERLAKPYREASDYRYLVAKWRRYHQEAMTPDRMT
jgi:ring-1,2-phenylacetyl-CoA epoxidase subunit PaaB